MFELMPIIGASLIGSGCFMLGAIVGLRSERERSVTKIKLAQDKAESANHTARTHKARNIQLTHQLESMRQMRDAAWVELDKCGELPKRDAKGRFVK